MAGRARAAETSTTARPCFLSTSRWNSARSRGGISASRRWISSRAPASSSLIARCSARQSLIRSSCSSVSPGGSSPARRGRRATSRSPPRARGRGPRSPRIWLLDAVDLVERGRVFAARLHAAELRLVLLELLSQLRELAFGAAPFELGLREPLLQLRDRLDLLLVLAVDLDEVLGDRVALSSRVRARTGSGSAAGRAGPSRSLTGSPRKEPAREGVPQ